MANYNPVSYSLNYKKYINDTVTTNSVVYTTDYLGAGPISLTGFSLLGLPPWLEVLNKTVDITFTSIRDLAFDLRVKAPEVENLPPGNYTARLFIHFSYKERIVTKTYNDAVGFDVFLTVEDTVFLSITPSTLVFPYVIGSDVPPSKYFQITSGNTWVINKQQTWLSLSKTQGYGNSSVPVTVDPTGLPVGRYEDIVYIADGSTTRTAVVVLDINEGDTPTDYLYVTPRNLEFVSELNIANPKQKTIYLDVSGNWTATPTDSWIEVSQSSGASGIIDIDISVNSTALDVGYYAGSVSFAQGDLIKKVYVALRVIEFKTQGLQTLSTYYADDRNKLVVTATADNTYLLLDAVAANGVDNVPYEHEAPYHKGTAAIIVGLETNDLAPILEPLTNLATSIKSRITPVNIGLTAFNVNKNTDAVTKIEEFTNLYFLKGKTPLISNKLCYIPSEITVTNKAVLNLVVRADSANLISITGDVTANIGASIAANKFVYSAVINLADFNLVPGNSINIAFASLSVDVNIKPNEPEETLIAFENEWGEHELFNCTGLLTKAPEFKETTTEVAIEGQTATKVVSIDYGVNYTLNTGLIYSQEEVDWLALILKAKHKFIYINGEPIEIMLSTKTLETYKTRDYLKSFKLTFKRAVI